MSDRTKIEWADATWNPVAGCTPVSIGCENCYAARMAKRLQAMGVAKYAEGFEPHTIPGALDVPMRWRKPRRIFVGSMGDLFHPQIEKEYVYEVFLRMQQAPQHTFMVLTKRPHLMAAWFDGYAGDGGWPSNIWLGTSIETEDYLFRLDHLVSCPPQFPLFVSLEPLLGPITVIPHLKKLKLMIVGCESGPSRRPMDLAWVEKILVQCRATRVEFMLKQAEIDGRVKKMADLNRKWRYAP